MITKNVFSFCFLSIIVIYTEAGMDQFLRNSLYSIQSMKDDGALSLTNTHEDIHKRVTIEKWNGLENQKWMVRDFQSIGLYDLTPLLQNTSSNVVTYQFTKNVYSYKRQWKVNLLSHQRYQIKNPESGRCLTNMGSHVQVDETDCNKDNPTNQVWKFRMLRK